MELRNKKINFLGDSITQGVGTADEQSIFLNVMRDECGLAAARNYGISGTRIARQYVENDYCTEPAFCDRYQSMDDDADVIVVFGGTNDHGHGQAPLGTFDDRTEETYYGAWHVLLRGLIEKYPEAVIVVMTPLHKCMEDVPSMGNGKPLKVYCDILKEVCEYYAVPVLVLYAPSGIQPEVPVLRETYMPDGIHPNNAGNRLIASRLTGFLRAL